MILTYRADTTRGQVLITIWDEGLDTVTVTVAHRDHAGEVWEPATVCVPC
jgi:anti-sigma regulatory factor (Ser/Thr protein kinase)